MYVMKSSCVFIEILLHCHRNAVRYVFGPLIQKELDQFAFEWNHHHIRHSNMAELPHGVPEVLYHFPNIHGGYIAAYMYFHVAMYMCTFKINLFLRS